MPTILYLGDDSQALKSFRAWLDNAIVQIEINPDSLFQEEMREADVILLECETLQGTFLQELLDYPKRSFLEKIPLILLINASLEEIPQAILSNSQIDWIEKPLQKQQVCKRVQQSLLSSQNQFQLAQQKQTVVRQAQRFKTVENQILLAQKEKQTLLQEIHHRVKNNLQIVSSILTLQSSEQTDARLVELLKSTQSRVDTISLIHKKLYESPSFAEIDMKDYIEQQISNIFSHFSTQIQHIALDFYSDSFQLDIDRALHCALLINELVVNVIRHAFEKEQAGQLQVYLEVFEEKRLSLRIADNGRGLPAHINFQQAQSTGLRLVHHLISQLGGSLALSRESGTTYQLEFALA